MSGSAFLHVDEPSKTSAKKLRINLEHEAGLLAFVRGEPPSEPLHLRIVTLHLLYVILTYHLVRQSFQTLQFRPSNARVWML